MLPVSPLLPQRSVVVLGLQLHLGHQAGTHMAAAGRQQGRQLLYRDGPRHRCPLPPIWANQAGNFVDAVSTIMVVALAPPERHSAGRALRPFIQKKKRCVFGCTVLDSFVSKGVLLWKKMMMPAYYNVLSTEEMTYTEGGATATMSS